MIGRFLILFWILATPVFAVEPEEILKDPELEARARAISAELRCLVCRNESIDESNAELARDLRLLVRERLLAGDSDAEVLAYITERYGEYVLLNPTKKGLNLLLWVSGPVMLLMGLWVAWAYIGRSSTHRVADDALTEEEQARLEDILRK